MMRLGADAGTAEDLAHETLIAVGRRVALFRAHKGSAEGWIFAIARNLRIDRLRREVPWQELPPEPLDRAFSLSPEQREVVALSYLDGRRAIAGAGNLANLDETVEHRPVADPPDCVWVASETPARFHRLFACLIQPFHGL